MMGTQTICKKHECNGRLEKNVIATEDYFKTWREQIFRKNMTGTKAKCDKQSDTQIII